MLSIVITLQWSVVCLINNYQKILMNLLRQFEPNFGEVVLDGPLPKICLPSKMVAILTKSNKGVWYVFKIFCWKPLSQLQPNFV